VNCEVDGCPRDAKRRKRWCQPHYQRGRDEGWIEPFKYPPEADRFWAKVNKTETCWLWTAARDRKGYGHFGLTSRKTVLAHRYAYQALVGEIPQGLELDHLCRNPPCINPAHLEPVTSRINALRGFGQGGLNARKTHCPQGHEYDTENTGRDRNGNRYCRTCNKARSRARTRAMREASWRKSA
jgi:hypothetical protein